MAGDEQHLGSRRPRDRRAQIATKAAELFAQRGFQSVRMDDIAEAAGITARAIYRHFEHKQDLLSHVILGQQSPLIAVIEELSRAEPGKGDPHGGLLRLADAIMDNRRLSILWQREARHLDKQDFRLIRERLMLLADAYQRLFVRPQRAELDDYGVEVRTWAVTSILSSPAYFEVSISRPRLVRELVDASERAIRSPSGAVRGDPLVTGPRHAPGSRREQLMAAAARAFRRSGYAGASIDDIGREVGLVGPALYRYFDGKGDILVAALTRFSEWRALEVLRALEEEPRASQVIVRLIDRYVRLAIEGTDLLAVSLTERLFLPDEVRERLDRIEAENLAEWQRWLVEARPDLDSQRATVLVHVTRAVIDDSVRTPRVRADASFELELRAIAHATLGI